MRNSKGRQANQQQHQQQQRQRQHLATITKKILKAVLMQRPKTRANTLTSRSAKERQQKARQIAIIK